MHENADSERLTIDGYCQPLDLAAIRDRGSEPASYTGAEETAWADVNGLLQEIDRLRAALEQIGRCCGNSNFVANRALGYGNVAHPDAAHKSDRSRTNSCP